MLASKTQQSTIMLQEILFHLKPEETHVKMLLYSTEDKFTYQTILEQLREKKIEKQRCVRHKEKKNSYY